MKTIIQQLNDIQTRPEYFSAGILVLYGLMFINPYSSMFEKIPRLYSPMREIVDSEMFWGGLYSSIGVLAILAVRFGVLKLRGYTSLMLCVAFFSISSLLYIGDGLNPGVSTYGMIAIFNLWSFFIFKEEHKDKG